jgi:hypothetical protein
MPVYVPLPTQVQDALRELARRELRDPRLQARLLVEDGLRREGLLAAPEQKTAPAGAATA